MPHTGALESFLRWLEEQQTSGNVPEWTTYKQLAKASGASEATVRRGIVVRYPESKGVRGKGIALRAAHVSPPREAQSIVLLALSGPEHSGVHELEARLAAHFRGVGDGPRLSVVRISINESTPRDYLRAVVDSAAAVVTHPGPSLDRLRLCYGGGKPILVLNPNDLPHSPLSEESVVSCDLCSGAEALAKHFYSQLVRPGNEFPRVAFFLGTDNDLQGWRKALKDAFGRQAIQQHEYRSDGGGIVPRSALPADSGRPGYVYRLTGEVAGRYMASQLVKDWNLESPREDGGSTMIPFGIVCVGEGVARGALDFLSREGFAIGIHIHLAEVDPRGAKPRQFLTSLGPDYAQLGDEAGRMVRRLLPKAAKTAPPTSEAVVGPTLIRRRSTGDWVQATWRVAPPAVIKDLEGKLLYGNPLLEHMLGQSVREIRNKKPGQYWKTAGEAIERAEREVALGNPDRPRITVERSPTQTVDTDRFSYRFLIPETTDHRALIAAMGFPIQLSLPGESSPASTGLPVAIPFQSLPVHRDDFDMPEIPPDAILRSFFTHLPVSVAVRTVAPKGSQTHIYHHLLLNPLVCVPMEREKQELVTTAEPVQLETQKKLYRSLDTQWGDSAQSANKPLYLSSKESSYERYVLRYPMFDGFHRIVAECSLGVSGDAMQWVYEQLTGPKPKLGDDLAWTELTPRMLLGTPLAVKTLK